MGSGLERPSGDRVIIKPKMSLNQKQEEIAYIFQQEIENHKKLLDDDSNLSKDYKSGFIAGLYHSRRLMVLNENDK